MNDIAAKLGSSVRTFSIAVPNAAAFYAPAENQHMLQTDMIAACYDRLKELKRGVVSSVDGRASPWLAAPPFILMTSCAPFIWSGLFGMGRSDRRGAVTVKKGIYLASVFLFLILLLWLCTVSLVGSTSSPSMYAQF